MWPFSKKQPNDIKPDPPLPTVVRTEPTTPACMQFASEETSEFGRQVAMTMELEPYNWSVHPSYRMFGHPQLGSFEFNEDDRLRHMGDNSYGPGSMRPPGKQRALTHGDQIAIVDSLQAMLLKAIEIKEPERSTAGVTAAPPKQVNPFQGLLSGSQMQQAQMQQMRNIELAEMQRMLMQTPDLKMFRDDFNDAFKYALGGVHAAPTKHNVLSNGSKS